MRESDKGEGRKGRVTGDQKDKKRLSSCASTVDVSPCTAVRDGGPTPRAPLSWRRALLPFRNVTCTSAIGTAICKPNCKQGVGNRGEREIMAGKDGGAGVGREYSRR